MELRFYTCPRCGGVFLRLPGARGAEGCCGPELKELVPGVTDGAAEKHVPVWQERDGQVTVSVGAAEHPMLEEHSIQWVLLQTAQGVQLKALRPGDRPEARFPLCQGDRVEAVYACCDLHGLWKA